MWTRGLQAWLARKTDEDKQSGSRAEGFGGASPIPDVVNVVDVTFEKGPLGISLRQRTNAKENRRKMIIVYKWETANKAPILIAKA